MSFEEEYKKLITDFEIQTLEEEHTRESLVEFDESLSDDINLKKRRKQFPVGYVSITEQLGIITNIIENKVAKTEDIEKSKREIINHQKIEISLLKENLNEYIVSNNELRKFLDDKYSAKILFVISTALSVGLIISIILWQFSSLILIHPVISIPLLVGTLGFAALSFWRTH